MSLDDLFGPQEPSEPEEPRKPREPKLPREPKPSRAPRPPREPKEPQPPREPRAAREPRAPRDPGEPRSRSTLILSIIAGILAVAVAVVVGIALTRPSGGDGTDGATPPNPVPPAPATSSTSTPTPTAPVTTSTLTLAATGFTLQGEDGDEFTHAWADAAEPAIAALTEAFGSEPTTDVESGDSRTYAYTVYSWDGFRFADVLLSEGNKPRDQVDTPTYVGYSANEVGDVAITAEFGLSIGMSLADARELGPDSESTTAPPILRFGSDRDTFFVDGARTYGVRVTTDGTVVTDIVYRFTPPA